MAPPALPDWIYYSVYRMESASVEDDCSARLANQRLPLRTPVLCGRVLSSFFSELPTLNIRKVMSIYKSVIFISDINIVWLFSIVIYEFVGCYLLVVGCYRTEVSKL